MLRVELQYNEIDFAQLQPLFFKRPTKSAVSLNTCALQMRLGHINLIILYQNQCITYHSRATLSWKTGACSFTRRNGNPYPLLIFGSDMLRNHKHSQGNGFILESCYFPVSLPFLAFPHCPRIDFKAPLWNQCFPPPLLNSFPFSNPHCCSQYYLDSVYFITFYRDFLSADLVVLLQTESLNWS